MVNSRNYRSGYRTSFGIFETGVDIRKITDVIVFKHQIDIGSYYRFQHFNPDWVITNAPNIHNDIDNIQEIGFSTGLKTPRKIFGIAFERVRVGYKFGSDVEGFTIGGEFPF